MQLGKRILEQLQAAEFVAAVAATAEFVVVAATAVSSAIATYG